MLAERKPPDLPISALITFVLLLGVCIFATWLIASYPGNPSQRAGPDNCETVAQQNNGAEDAGNNSNHSIPAFDNDKSTPQNGAGNQTKEKIDTERQIAKYNCQLAIYTKDLAFFTEWLVFATSGLIAIGLLQGYFLKQSVGVANRAATEARDAITAAQAGADAANTHAQAAEEANIINREILIASNRPWVKVGITIDRPLEYDEHGAILGIMYVLRNVGRTPATFVWPHARIVVNDPGEIDYTAIQQNLLREVHADRARFRRIQLGHTIFPDDEMLSPFSYHITNDELLAAKLPNVDRTLLTIAIVGFAEYQFGDVTHETGFIYTISKLSADCENMRVAIFREDGNVPKDLLVLLPWLIHGGGFFAT